jgi:hypothetical protein
LAVDDTVTPPPPIEEKPAVFSGGSLPRLGSRTEAPTVSPIRVQMLLAGLAGPVMWIQQVAAPSVSYPIAHTVGSLNIAGRMPALTAVAATQAADDGGRGSGDQERLEVEVEREHGRPPTWDRGP